MRRENLLPLLFLLIVMPACAEVAKTQSEIPSDLTCPIDETEATIAEGILVFHRCYGIRGHAVTHVAQIDLSNPKLRFQTTAGDSSGGREFAAMTTSEFAKRGNLLIAVNAGYFEPFDSGTHGNSPYPAQGDSVNVMGQHIVEGIEVSDNEIDIPRFRLRVDGAFCVTRNSVTIVKGVCPDATEFGIGAGPILMQAGNTPAFDRYDARFSLKRAPRTVLALNRDRSVFWIIVVDGRQPNYSQGMNLPEMADLLRTLGAHDALNLDGGGSSVLVGPGGRLLSRPIQQRIPGRERVVANHLGVALR